MNRYLTLAASAALQAALPLSAQAPAEPAKTFPAPGEIVAAAKAEEWVAIAPSDLLVMDLAGVPDGKVLKPRRVVIQLMPPPFSQGWIGNIRKLAAVHWWDGTSINRVQDNYVVQWGDATEKKALPDGLAVVPESEYETISDDKIQAATASSNLSIFFISPMELKESSDGAIILSVSGRIINPTLLKQTIPDIIAQIKDVEGRVVYSWKIRAPKNVLAANKKVSFTEVVSDVPASSAIVTLAFEQTGNHLPSLSDNYAPDAAFAKGWPLAVSSAIVWPTHCYGMVGVGRNLSPDTGSGAELYTVIGHAPRHLDRNIALVGRVIEGMEHLSSLPRGTGALGFYESEAERVPIRSVRLGTDAKDVPAFEYLSTESASFAKYADARANRRDPFFIRPAGGADICNIPVPVRRKGK